MLNGDLIERRSLRRGFKWGKRRHENQWGAHAMKSGVARLCSPRARDGSPGRRTGDGDAPPGKRIEEEATKGVDREKQQRQSLKRD